MEGFRDCISTASPAPTRPPPLLCRTFIILPSTGCSCRLVYDRNCNSLARIFSLRNTSTYVLVTVSVQDTFPQGCHLSSSCQAKFYVLARGPESLALAEDTRRPVPKPRQLVLESLLWVSRQAKDPGIPRGGGGL